MIPALGLMLAVYALARLIQVPIEHAPIAWRWILLLIVSLPAMAVIGYLAVELILAGASVPDLPPSLR